MNVGFCCLCFVCYNVFTTVLVVINAMINPIHIVIMLTLIECASLYTCPAPSAPTLNEFATAFEPYSLLNNGESDLDSSVWRFWRAAWGVVSCALAPGLTSNVTTVCVDDIVPELDRTAVSDTTLILAGSTFNAVDNAATMELLKSVGIAT